MAAYLTNLSLAVIVILLFHSAVCSAQDCDGNFVASPRPQFLSSPSHPMFYGEDLHCVTHLTSSDPSKVIEFTVIDFDLEDSQNCQKDALVVYDGVDGGQRLMQHACGGIWAWPHYPEKVRSTGHVATVVFITDRELGDGFRGFNLSYKIVDPEPYLIFIAAPDEGRIHAIHRTNAVNFGIFPEGIRYPKAVDYDPLEGYLYYTDSGARNVGRYNIEETTTEILHTKQIGDPFGLRVDVVNRLLYWTDSLLGTVSASNLEGTKRATIVARSSGLGFLGAIVVEPDRGYIYFTDWGDSAKILRASGDGSSLTTLVDDRISSPQGLAIDLDTRRLYWTDALLDTLSAYNTELGFRAEIIELREKDPFAITLDSGAFFITDEEFGAIELISRAPGGGQFRVFIGSIREPRGISLRPIKIDNIDPYQCPQEYCTGQDGLCLPKPNNAHTCKQVLPIIGSPGCPRDMHVTLPTTTATWREPSVTSPERYTVTSTRTHSPGQSFPTDITRVSYIYEDILGNKAFCNFTVTVSEPFELVCPHDIVAEAHSGQTEAAVTWTPPVDTQNQVAILDSRMQPGDFFPIGDTIVVYTAIVEGVTERCSFTISVIPAGTGVGPRFLNCPGDIVEWIRDGDTSTLIQWNELKLDDPDATILLQPGDMVYTRPRPGLKEKEFIIGDETVTILAADPEGNTAWCNFTVSVRVDRDPPRFHGCPDEINVDAKGGEDAVVHWTEPLVTDNSGVLTVDKTFPPGSTFPIGRTIVTYDAVDPYGNSWTCSFLVIVQDGDSMSNNAQQVDRNEPDENGEVWYVYIFGAVIALLLLVIIILLIIIVYRCRRKTPRGDPPIHGRVNTYSSPPDYQYAVSSSQSDATLAISGSNVRYRSETNPVANIADENTYDIAAGGTLPPGYDDEPKKVPLDEKDDVEKSLPPGFNSWDGQ